MCSPRPLQLRRAFTLTEMMVSLALVAIIMGASTSLVIVAARALAADRSSAGADAVAARAATSTVIEDLKVATQIIEQTPRAISMVVPDRTGDGSPDTIKYSWSGTRGDPLVRALNGGTPGIVAANVHNLNFAYLSKTVGRPPPVKSGVRLLDGYAPAETINGDNSYALTSSGQAGLVFTPTLPDTAITWQVTRCQAVIVSKGLLASTANVTLRYADSNGKPTGAVLASGSASLLSLLSNQPAWCAFDVSPEVELDPKRSLCLTFTANSTLASAYMCYDTVPDTHNSRYMTSSDSGSTWTTPVASPLAYFRAFGTVTTQERETTDFQPLPSSPK